MRIPQYTQQDTAFPSLLPAWPIYKYWGVLAEWWKQIFQSHPSYTTLVIIAWADLPLDMTGVVTTDDTLHTFFWTIKIDTNNYVSWFVQSEDIFALHAKPLEAQFPFIRAYKHLDNVVPYIVNINKEQIVLEDILDTIEAHHGDDACYVYIQPEIWVEKIMEYIEASA